MKDYVRMSLETHLFFARIMKEHSLFLEAGFVSKDVPWMQRAAYFREEFENLLLQTVRISNRMVGSDVLNSGELATEFTLDAERETSALSGIPVNSSITEMEERLLPGFSARRDSGSQTMVQQLNERALFLLDGLIEFKETILKEVGVCRLFTLNYPLLIEHILREAKLYRDTVWELMRKGDSCFQTLQEIEKFWNQIMMEHALFIRGLLDPSEEELIRTANGFAMDFAELLGTAGERERRTTGGRRETLEETEGLRDFKAAGTKGLLDCKIKSIILPLLADHVLREANHYIRILEEGC